MSMLVSCRWEGIIVTTYGTPLCLHSENEFFFIIITTTTIYSVYLQIPVQNNTVLRSSWEIVWEYIGITKLGKVQNLRAHNIGNC